MKQKHIILIWILGLFLCCDFIWASKYSWNSTTGRFAFIVGANSGGAEREMLKFAVSDANSFLSILVRMGGVKKTNSTILFDPSKYLFLHEFTKIKKKLQQQKSKYRKIEFFFYFSGHSDETDIFLGRERLSYVTLRKMFKEVKADVKIAILDSCSSGAFTRIKGGKHRIPFLIDKSSDMEGYAFITSSSANEASQESDKIKGSFFTHYLLSGLNGAADISNDGMVTLNEVYQFAYNETLARTEKTISGPQHANYLIRMSGVGDVVLTDIRISSSKLIFDKDISGRLFIRNRSKKLIGEFYKPYGRRLKLGLGPGKYSVVNETDNKIYVASVSLSKRRSIILAKNKFRRISREATHSRGSIVESTDKKKPQNGKKVNKTRYLFNRTDNLEFTGHGGPYMHFSAVDNRFGYLMGGRGGFIINEKFVIGAAGMGLVTSIERKIDNKLEDVRFGYGGALFEYYFKPRSLVHISIATIIGAGGYGYNRDKVQEEYRRTKEDAFFVMEPEINLFLNVAPFFRIGVGAAYRFVYGLNNPNLRDSDISGKNGMSFSIMFSFGNFGL